MNQRILVLGCGMIGSAVAMDLARHDWDVTIADCDETRLSRVKQKYGIRIVTTDLSDTGSIATLAKTSSIVIGALPSAMGFRTLKAVVESGSHAVCISFMPEDARALHDLACRKGITAIVDCGVAPGLSNMMVGHAAARLSPCERVDVYVGGLPLNRKAPFEYKAGFSPHDVIDEYVDPATVVEHGRVVVKPALSEIEILAVPGVGELEAFLTDGLRTLIQSIDAPFMQEKTLRYPGHARTMEVLREAGFFSKDPIPIGARMIRPLDVTAALLFPQWTYQEGEPDITILRVAVEGRTDGARTLFTWDIIDRYDPISGLRSMSRTTAFPATIAARLIADGALPAGVHPPEVVGRMGLLDDVLAELKARGVHCLHKVERPQV
jgi:saccharopine dehydrogenase-like NADP-dependent oxidoreductase